MSIEETIETLEETPRDARRSKGMLRGLVLVFSDGAPRSIACPVRSDEGLVLGRDWLLGSGITDDRVSKAHAKVTLTRTGLVIEDLGSRNGTHVDGVRIDDVTPIGPAPGADRGRIVRIGSSVLLAIDDCAAFAKNPTKATAGFVRGPKTAEMLHRIDAIAKTSASMLVLGESGVGKENAARAFHQGGPRARGPFVPVNCAAVPESLAERLFFGAKVGAFSGSTDAEGYVRAAHKGTLFLDEIGELDLTLQAKLLRLLDAREILPVGAARAETVDVAICAATNRDLRDRVGRGAFREDLYYRLAEPKVEIPPLRARPEEISFLVHEAAKRIAPDLKVSAKLVEACAMRAWPGNVRELLASASQAARRALAGGHDSITDEDLDPLAGTAVERAEDATAGRASAEPSPRALPDDATIERALSERGGNVSGAAKALGVHRNQLRRWLGRRS